MVERELSKKRYFLAFIFTSAVFIIGLLLGLLLTSLKFDFIDQYQQDFRTDILTFDVQDMLLQEDICKFDVNQLDDEFGVMSEQVSVLEDKLGKYDEDVLRMKEYYSLLEIRHMLLVEKLKNYCDYDRYRTTERQLLGSGKKTIVQQRMSCCVPRPKRAAVLGLRAILGTRLWLI